MSSEDQVRPYHAKSGSETADTLAEVLEHAAAREEAAHKRAAPKKQPKWMLPLGINLAVFAVYLLIAPPSWVVVNPIEGLPPAEQETNLRFAMFLQISAIDGFIQTNRRVPETLAELPGGGKPGMEFRRVGLNGYELIGSSEDVTVRYSSEQPLREWYGNGDDPTRGG